MKKLLLLYLFIFFLAACKKTEFAPHFYENNEQIQLEEIKKLPQGKLTIAQIDEIMGSVGRTNEGPSFEGEIADFDTNPNFKLTPTGSYITDLVFDESNESKIEKASTKVLKYIKTTKPCENRCSAKFKEMFENNFDQLKNFFKDITKSLIENEIRNNENFMPFYHGFASECYF